MSRILGKAGAALVGATLVALLSLLPAAAQGGYGGGYGSMGGYNSGSSSGSMSYMHMGSYGSNSYGNSYGSKSYGNNYGPYGRVRTFAYWVRFGDTLSRIAARFHTSVGAILRANPQIKNANLIFAGMTIWVPFGAPYYQTSYGGSAYGSGSSSGSSMYGPGY